MASLPASHERKAGRVYLVEASGFEWSQIVAVFSTIDEAEAYAVECDAQPKDDIYDNYTVHTWLVDAPRDDRLGTWVVRVDKHGKVLTDASSWLPTQRPRRGAFPLTGEAWEGGYLAYGATFEEAKARALSALSAVNVSGPDVTQSLRVAGEKAKRLLDLDASSSSRSAPSE